MQGYRLSAFKEGNRMESVAHGQDSGNKSRRKKNVLSVKLMIGASNADDSAVCCLQRTVNKLIMLIENNDWNFDIWLVRFSAEKS